eukprot:TRINITY_DN6638_c0_g1_i4.p1 TRINITY_DN6638_c0_g1~~TRINITY_DN6638_c0_g1_i4.p1  ORF type:complete len:297 (-),score=27.41 TRINITY_DN6638_c0_g1_i4:8-898(-)
MCIRDRTLIRSLFIAIWMIEPLQITDEGFTTLVSSLPQLNQMTDLTLLFSGRKEGFVVTAAGITALVTALDALPLLVRVELELSKCPELDIGCFKDLFAAMTRLRNLLILFLNFSNSQGFDDIALTSLGLFLPKLPLLSSFGLDVSSTNLNNESSIISFLSFLKTQEKVQHLYLSFANTPALSNALCESIELPKTLLSVALRISSSEGITDDGLANLGEQLKVMEAPRAIRIDFSRCDNITQEGLFNVMNKLLTLSSLTSLTIDVTLCRQIGRDAVKSATKLLQTTLQNTFVEIIW